MYTVVQIFNTMLKQRDFTKEKTAASAAVNFDQAL